MPNPLTNGKYSSRRELVDAVWFHKFATDNTHRMIGAITLISPAAVTRALNMDRPSQLGRARIKAGLDSIQTLKPLGVRQMDTWITKGTKDLDQIADELGIQRNRLEGQLSKYRGVKGDRTLQRRQLEERADLDQANQNTADLLIEQFEAACCLIEDSGLSPEAMTAVQEYLQDFRSARDQYVNVTKVPHPAQFAGFFDEATQEQFKLNIRTFLGEVDADAT